jgi:hypothetical protein
MRPIDARRFFSMRGNVDKSKKESQRDTTFARGGRAKMFKQQAAGPDRPGNVGKDQSPAPGAKYARGGPKVSAGGFARRAIGGHTGPCEEE